MPVENSCVVHGRVCACHLCVGYIFVQCCIYFVVPAQKNACLKCDS